MLDVTGNFISLVFRWIFISPVTSFEVLCGKMPTRVFTEKSKSALYFLVFMFILNEFLSKGVYIISEVREWSFIQAIMEALIVGGLLSTVNIWCFKDIRIISLSIQGLITSTFMTYAVALSPWNDGLAYLPAIAYFIIFSIGFVRIKKSDLSEVS